MALRFRCKPSNINGAWRKEEKKGWRGEREESRVLARARYPVKLPRTRFCFCILRYNNNDDDGLRARCRVVHSYNLRGGCTVSLRGGYPTPRLKIIFVTFLEPVTQASMQARTRSRAPSEPNPSWMTRASHACPRRSVHAIHRGFINGEDRITHARVESIYDRDPLSAFARESKTLVLDTSSSNRLDIFSHCFSILRR